MLAHLSMLLNLVTGFLGIVAAFLIFLVYRDRSRYVANQALQSVLFQVLVWFGGGVIVAVAWTVSGLLVPVLGLGCLLMPFALLASLALLAVPIYSIIAAVECNNGRDFRYWLIGDWAK